MAPMDIAAQDNRRIAGVHSLIGAVIRQAVLDHKSNYDERIDEHPAYLFLYQAGLLPYVDSLYAAILSSNPEAYHEARKGTR
jgi:hypothetical protein